MRCAQIGLGEDLRLVAVGGLNSASRVKRPLRADFGQACLGVTRWERYPGKLGQSEIGEPAIFDSEADVAQPGLGSNVDSGGRAIRRLARPQAAVLKVQFRAPRLGSG